MFVSIIYSVDLALGHLLMRLKLLSYFGCYLLMSWTLCWNCRPCIYTLSIIMDEVR